MAGLVDLALGHWEPRIAPQARIRLGGRAAPKGTATGVAIDPSVAADRAKSDLWYENGRSASCTVGWLVLDASLCGRDISKDKATSLGYVARLDRNGSAKHRPVKGERVELTVLPTWIYVCWEILEELTIERPPSEGRVERGGIHTDDPRP